MFKSKAQKEAEHKLKVQKELEKLEIREKLIAEQAARNREKAKQMQEYWWNPERRSYLITAVLGVVALPWGPAIGPASLWVLRKTLRKPTRVWVCWTIACLVWMPVIVNANTESAKLAEAQRVAEQAAQEKQQREEEFKAAQQRAKEEESERIAKEKEEREYLATYGFREFNDFQLQCEQLITSEVGSDDFGFFNTEKSENKNLGILILEISVYVTNAFGARVEQRWECQSDDGYVEAQRLSTQFHSN